MQLKTKRTAQFPAITFLLLAFVLCSIFACEETGPEDSSNYPSRPITFLVPWAAGGMTDISSRTMAATLQEILGQPVNVVNRTGGAGVVGHLALARAKADGYTLGAVTVEITMLKHLGITDLSYENYTPLALMINNAAAITVRADAPYDSVQDLIDAIKANPGQLNASGTGRGGIWDLARVGFLQSAGLNANDMPWVPSKGSTPALQELIAGGVDVVTASLTEVSALRKAGEVKTLAVMAEERLPAFPDVPTLKELGIDWSIGGWVSVCAPPNLSEELKTVLAEAVAKAAKEASFVEPMTTAGSNLQFLDSEALGRFMAGQHATNGKLMKEAGIK